MVSFFFQWYLHKSDVHEFLNLDASPFQFKRKVSDRTFLNSTFRFVAREKERLMKKVCIFALVYPIQRCFQTKNFE